MPKDVVNAYGIGDGEKGNSQEMSIIGSVEKLQHPSKTSKSKINSRIENWFKTTPRKRNKQ